MKQPKDLTERLVKERMGASSDDPLLLPLLLGHADKSSAQVLRSSVKRGRQFLVGGSWVTWNFCGGVAGKLAADAQAANDSPGDCSERRRFEVQPVVHHVGRHGAKDVGGCDGLGAVALAKEGDCAGGVEVRHGGPPTRQSGRGWGSRYTRCWWRRNSSRAAVRSGGR